MKEFIAYMKEIYTAVNRDQAASALTHFEQPTNEAGARQVHLTTYALREGVKRS